MLSNNAHSHHILTTIEPVRNLFAALFLSCIGAPSLSRLLFPSSCTRSVTEVMMAACLGDASPQTSPTAAAPLPRAGVVMQPHFLWMHFELLLLSTMMVLFAKVLVTGETPSAAHNQPGH
jgi:Kef-type K+ transport system membrane component KefB